MLINIFGGTEMSIVKGLPENYNTLSPISFKFAFEALPNVTYFCQSVSLPSLTLGEVTVPTPLRDYTVHGDNVTYSTIDISFIVDENMENYLEIFNWMRGLAPTTDLSQRRGLESNSRTGVTTTGILTILTNNMNANKTVMFYDCWPTTLGEIAFDSTQTEVPVIATAASFNFTDLRFETVK